MNFSLQRKGREVLHVCLRKVECTSLSPSWGKGSLSAPRKGRCSIESFSRSSTNTAPRAREREKKRCFVKKGSGTNCPPRGEADLIAGRGKSLVVYIPAKRENELDARRE